MRTTPPARRPVTVTRGSLLVGVAPRPELAGHRPDPAAGSSVAAEQLIDLGARKFTD
jgi:hypothetical protein